MCTPNRQKKVQVQLLLGKTNKSKPFKVVLLE